MAKTMKSLLKISMAMRNLGALANYTMTKRFIQTSIHCGTNYNKETLVSPRPHLLSDHTQELSNSASLQEALKDCRQQMQIFSIVRTNHSQMTVDDAIVALNALVNIEKDKPNETKKIYENNEFLILCEILKKNMRSIDSNQALNALKAMIFFNVPTTSIIVQMLLQIIRHSVNDMPLQKISFLDFLLQKCENTPLVEALQIALPIVYENNVTTKLDRENIYSIRNALNYLSKKSKNSELFCVIFHALINCKQPLEPILAKSILWSLYELQCYPDGLPEVLNYVQNKLAGSVKSLSRRSILQLIQLITKKILAREQHFYHEGFLDACASAVISEDWGFIDAIEVLDKLIGIGHTQISLLDYIAAKCFEDQTLLTTCPPTCIAILVQAFSAADYKPVFWDTIQESVMSGRVLEDKSIDFPLLKLAICLLSLDCYCPKLMDKIFQNYAGVVPYKMIEKRRLLLIYQAITTLYPQYSRSLLIENVADFTRHNIRNYPLLASLECALGGSRYVLTNIRSKLGHFVDHALIMRKGGFPIAINYESATEVDEHPVIVLEDVKPPPDSQVILILYMPAYAYSFNTQRMKGNWLMLIKTLEALSGYTVIPIRSSMWTSLQEMEKIPYLMQAIRLKCDELSISANS